MPLPMVPMARGWLCSSILAWKVSYMMRKASMIDAVHIGAGLVHGVEEIGLEAIEVFQAQIHAIGAGALGHAVMRLGAIAQLVFGRARAGEMADGGMEGAADTFGAQSDGAIERPVKMGLALLADIGIGIDGVGVG